MCDACTQLAELDVDVALAELEQDVITLEAERGWSVPDATRPLHPHEVTARVRFAELDRIAGDAAQTAARHADQVRRAVLDALTDDLAEVVATGDAQTILARLRLLTSTTNPATLPGVQAAVDAAARQITAELEAAYRAAADQVAEEAARQGLPQQLLPDTTQLPPTSAEQRGMGEWARRVAEHPVNRVLTAAYEAAHRATRGDQPDPYDVLDKTFTGAEQASTAGTEDLARQAAGQAHGAGRARAAKATPTEPDQVYASELLDRNTCGPCATVDGRTYDSLESSLEDYPDAAGYRRCQGGTRCRGTLVFVWPTEAAPTLDVAGDNRSPNEAVPDRTPRGPSEVPPAPAPVAPPGPELPLDDVPELPAAAQLNPLTMSDDELDQALTAAMAREDYTAAEQLAAELDARDTTRGAGVWDQAERAEADAWTTPHAVDDPEVAADVVDDWDEATARAGDRRTDDEGGEWEFNPAYGWQYLGQTGTRTSRADLVTRVRADWDEYLWSMQAEAEAATRGVMIRRDRLSEFRTKFGTEAATGTVLFTGPAARAYYYASRELRDFWEQHPRLTYAEFAVERGITDRRTTDAASKAPGARDDARRRAEEDPEKRRQRQRDAAARRRRRAFADPDGRMAP